jgi:hypothetical protein
VGNWITATAVSRRIANSGSQWIDPTNRVVGLVMTQMAVIGSGAISHPIREAFYTAD